MALDENIKKYYLHLIRIQYDNSEDSAHNGAVFYIKYYSSSNTPITDPMTLLVRDSGYHNIISVSEDHFAIGHAAGAIIMLDGTRLIYPNFSISDHVTEI